MPDDTTEPTKAQLLARQDALAEEIQQAERDAEHWNRLHPSEAPLTIGWDLLALAARIVNNRQANA